MRTKYKLEEIQDIIDSYNALYTLTRSRVKSIVADIVVTLKYDYIDDIVIDLTSNTVNFTTFFFKRGAEFIDTYKVPIKILTTNNEAEIKKLCNISKKIYNAKAKVRAISKEKKRLLKERKEILDKASKYYDISNSIELLEEEYNKLTKEIEELETSSNIR